jgi:hypothetical protein
MENWNSIGTFVFTLLLLVVRVVILFYIFLDDEINGHPFRSFAAVEATTYLMTSVSFSLLIQWYEVYHILEEATGKK